MQVRKIISAFLINTFLGLILYSYLFYSELGEFPDIFANWTLLLFIIVSANIIGSSVYALNVLLNKIPLWKKKIGSRFILGIFINYAIILLTVTFILVVYLKLFNTEHTFGSLVEEYNEIKIRVYILTLILVVLLVVFDFLIYSYRYYSYGQIQNAKLARKQMQLQFEALKTQLSPHYLFNSLNTISSLLYKDISQSEEYIRKLAGTYQYILASDKKKLIRLGDEIAFIKDYCFLLNIRFGNAFKVNFHMNDQLLDYLIPPISIQILVENAVKHNVFDDDQPLEVDIISENQIVSVSNKILKTPANRESFKIGLSNIKKRYEVFTNKKVKVIKDGYFRVELPLLKSVTNG